MSSIEVGLKTSTTTLTGDFNGDSLTDYMLISNKAGIIPGLQVHLNFMNSKGSFDINREPIIKIPSGSNYGMSAAATDMDKDGDLDLLISVISEGWSVPAQTFYYENQGDGNFINKTKVNIKN